jgi:hypothetical protein
MGAVTADVLVEAGKEFGFPMETMLYNHLAYNIYPGQGAFIDVAIAAVELANQGLWNETVNIAEIMEDEKYNHAASVSDIISGWRLEFFLDDSEEDY